MRDLSQLCQPHSHVLLVSVACAAYYHHLIQKIKSEGGEVNILIGASLFAFFFQLIQSQILILQVIVEVPYLFLETAIFVTITYPMIGYYGSAYKVFWYFYATFCSLLYFSYLGMLLVPLTPNFMMTTILSSAFYTIFNLFAGFLVPEPVS